MNCDREPIHIPGAIQPHGCMLVCRLPDWDIVHVSANAADHLGGVDPQTLLDQPLDAVLPGRTVHDIRNVLQSAIASGTAERLVGAPVAPAGELHELAIHTNGELVFIEIVPQSGASASLGDPVTLVKGMIGRLKRAPTLDRFLQLAAYQVRAVTGYDRVMIYKFLPSGAGQVVAEALRADLTPFLGLRYPASDIPAQARELYKRQWLRLIPTVDYEPVPLVSSPNAAGTPVDMSLATLRSVSPIHLEYLRNMGSQATLTVSLLCDDQLWGLIACHHHAPRRLSASTCAAAEMFGQIFSLQIEAREKQEESDAVTRSHEIHDRLIAEILPDATLFENLAAAQDKLFALIGCDGIGIWADDRFTGFGAVPDTVHIRDLITLLGERSSREIFSSHALSTLMPGIAGDESRVAGVLAIPFSRMPRDYILFFRTELLETVTWGGDPNKPVEGDEQGRISPRKSFAAWREAVRDRCRPWSNAELQIAETLRISLLDVIVRRADLIVKERRVAQESQTLLIAELNHRVKNILALIRSLIRQSRHGADTIESFTADVESRIRALAYAHDQLTQSGWNGAPLRRLLEAEGRAWVNEHRRISFDGPPVILDARAYQTLALVVHEMMTNAAKYGALSGDSGHLTVKWAIRTDRSLRIEWQERGGPVVKPPSHRGFGSVLIDQVVPFELRGEAVVEYRLEGIYGCFSIPAEFVHLSGAEPEPMVTPAVAAADLSGRKLLLVEDSMMIAFDAQELLEEMGATVEVAANVADACRALSLTRFDAAVLDINLSGETSFGIADDLARAGLPFIFATGYGGTGVIPERFNDIAVVSKPYDKSELSRALGRHLAR